MRLRDVGLASILAGCGFSAPEGAVKAPDTAGGEEDEDSGGGDSGGADSGTVEDPDPSEVDDDGDGYTEQDGDCDDGASGVHPGAADGCAGGDEDCDGEADEDAAEEDIYEPNDASPEDLGSLNDDPVHAIQAALHNDADIDRFAFSFEDSSWSWSFTLDVTLSGIPEGAAYGLALYGPDGSLVGDDSGGDSLALSLEEALVTDQGGTYEIEVYAEQGADCGRNYLLTVELTE